MRFAPRLAHLYKSTEIMQFDWLKQVMQLSTASKSALFQDTYATLKFVYDIGSRIGPFLQKDCLKHATGRPFGWSPFLPFLSILLPPQLPLLLLLLRGLFWLTSLKMKQSY